ncbi:MAG: hypothetical protein WBF73_13060 [Bradyrhizobium sp.]|jgi:hypothetical protein
MRRIIALIACALINAWTIPGIAAVSTLSNDVSAGRAVSATVYGKSDNAADNEKTCRAYAASFYESVVLRQTAEGRVDGARVLIALESVIDAFKHLSATKCVS